MSKVLLVTNIFPPEIGGPATFIDRLAHSLARRDHRVTVVCTSQGSRHESDAKRPFSVRRVDFGSRERYEVLVRMRLALEMARHRMIFVNGLERYVAEVTRVLRRPYVLKIVGDTVWETARNRGMTNLSIDAFQVDPVAQARFAADIRGRNAWVTAARRIVVPSEYLRRLVAGWGVPLDRIAVVLNGTTLPAQVTGSAPKRNGRFRALFVGRLTNWKGIETLLLAANNVPDIEVEIVGDGPEWPHLVELSAQLGLQERVTFAGRQSADEVRAAMDRAHVLVLTSLYEGLSHTVLEGMSSGLPCIVSDRGGNAEVVTDRHDGLVIPPQNVARLTEALRSLAADQSLRSRLAAAAVVTSRAFDLSQTVINTERHLLAAIGGDAEDAVTRPLPAPPRSSWDRA